MTAQNAYSIINASAGLKPEKLPNQQTAGEKSRRCTHMSMSHLIVIAVIALIVLGPEKLPQVARMVGKALAEFRRITGDFRSTIETEMRELERETALKELRQSFPEHVHYDLQETQEATIAPSTVGRARGGPCFDRFGHQRDGSGHRFREAE